MQYIFAGVRIFKLKLPVVNNALVYKSYFYRYVLFFAFQFYIIMNVAVGGTNGFFPDGVTNPSPKPWWNGSPTVSNSPFYYFNKIFFFLHNIVGLRDQKAFSDIDRGSLYNIFLLFFVDKLFELIYW